MKAVLLFSYFCLSSCQLKVDVSALKNNRWNSFHAAKHTCDVNVFDLPPQDKRRIQENIAKKRRQIEEEKLKLQYIKVLFAAIRRTSRRKWTAGAV